MFNYQQGIGQVFAISLCPPQQHDAFEVSKKAGNRLRRLSIFIYFNKLN